MTTPIGQIDLAMDGKIDFVMATNPWGTSKKQPTMQPPDQAGDALIAFLASF